MLVFNWLLSFRESKRKKTNKKQQQQKHYVCKTFSCKTIYGSESYSIVKIQTQCLSNKFHFKINSTDKHGYISVKMKFVSL